MAGLLNPRALMYLLNCTVCTRTEAKGGLSKCSRLKALRDVCLSDQNLKWADFAFLKEKANESVPILNGPPAIVAHSERCVTKGEIPLKSEGLRP